jgi:hypothetical protein
VISGGILISDIDLSPHRRSGMPWMKHMKRHCSRAFENSIPP